MSRQVIAEAMQEKRAESLSRRPSPVAPGVVGSQEKKFEGRRKHAAACEIAVDRIIPDPHQPRQEFDPEALAQLASSLKSVGQITPIQVRWSDAEGSYVIIAGERRWRAAGIAGLASLKCVAIEGELAPDQLLEMQLMENACRKDLTFAEQGRAFRALMEARGLTQRELAEMLRIDQANVAHAVALLGLPGEVMAAVEAGRIVPSTAYEISKAADPATQIALARDVVENGSSRATVRERVARARPGKGRGGRARPVPVTSRAFKIGDGYRVEVARKKGIDPAGLVEALAQALDRARSELIGVEGEAA